VWEVVNDDIGRDRTISPMTIAVVTGLLLARELDLV
jgi:hypothetical protein